MLNRREACLFLLAAGLVAGCTPAAVKEMSKPSKTVEWKELKALQTPDVNMALILSANRGDVPGVKKAVSDPKFTEAVDAFEKAPIPSQFASPAREAAKKKAVEAYKNLQELGKAGSAKDIKDGVKTMQDAMNELTNPDLK